MRPVRVSVSEPKGVAELVDHDPVYPAVNPSITDFFAVLGGVAVHL